MNFIDAYKDLIRGYSIRRKEWSDAVYFDKAFDRLRWRSSGISFSVFKREDVTANDWEIYHEFFGNKRTKTVYQWRYQTILGWRISPNLMTEDEVSRKWNKPSPRWERHAGPFEVPE